MNHFAAGMTMACGVLKHGLMADSLKAEDKVAFVLSQAEYLQ